MRFWVRVRVRVRVRFKKTQRVRVRVRVRSKNIFWVRVRVRARLDKRQGVRVRYKKGKLGAGAGAVHQKLHADVGCGWVQLSNSKLINLTFRTVIIILKDRAVQRCSET